MNSKELEDAYRHALAEHPNECCGLMVRTADKTVYVPCRNVADPSQIEDAFRIDPACYLRASRLGEIVAVFHSHTKRGPQPSPHDRVACDYSGLPWIICSPTMADGGMWTRLLPKPERPPLIGRPWVWEAADCYSLVRDWHVENTGLKLPDLARPESPDSDEAKAFFENNWKRLGFKAIANPAETLPGDVAMIALVSTNADHVGVILDGGMILHHLRDRPSSREIYGGWLRRRTVRIVRFSDGAT